jgi:hypothetical protein
MINKKKLITIGWDAPTTAQFLRDLPKMESTPFDGTAIMVQAKGDNFPEGLNTTPFRTGFSRIPWKRAWFGQAIKDLQAAQKIKTPLTDNFLRFDCNPGDVDWFDEAGWTQIVDHLRIAAWIAKETGLKGVLFDAEPYTKPFYPFDYKSQKNTSRRSFDEYRAKARERGKQAMQAMAEEFPDMTLLTLFMHSYLIQSNRYHGPNVIGENVLPQNTKKALFLHAYGLYDAFIDGWLDAITPKIRIVDATENGYNYSKDEHFFGMARKMKQYGPQLVSAKNKAKYTKQVEVGSAIYLDAHVKGLLPPYELPQTGTAPLGQHTAAALSAADSYVWVYSERGSWWPDPKELREWPKKEVFAPWENTLPGVTEALRHAKKQLVKSPRLMGANSDPLHDDYGLPTAPILPASATPISAKPRVNLLTNGDFKIGPTEAARPGASADWGTAGAPAHWSYWQGEFSTGRFDWDEAPSAARASNVREGVFLQSVPCQQGEKFLVTARAKVMGIGAASLAVSWKQDSKTWLVGRPRTLVFQSTWTDKSGYEWYETLVTAPAGAGLLICELCVSGQPSVQDSILWKDACVSKV